MWPKAAKTDASKPGAPPRESGSKMKIMMAADAAASSGPYLLPAALSIMSIRIYAPRLQNKAGMIISHCSPGCSCSAQDAAADAHEFAGRWQAFFDIADGVKTQTEYDSFVSTLNRTFPSATLEATPVDGDPVAVAEAILHTLNPPHSILYNVFLLLP